MRTKTSSFFLFFLWFTRCLRTNIYWCLWQCKSRIFVFVFISSRHFIACDELFGKVTEKNECAEVMMCLFARNIRWKHSCLVHIFPFTFEHLMRFHGIFDLFSFFSFHNLSKTILPIRKMPMLLISLHHIKYYHQFVLLLNVLIHWASILLLSHLSILAVNIFGHDTHKHMKKMLIFFLLKTQKTKGVCYFFGWNKYT